MKNLVATSKEIIFSEKNNAISRLLKNDLKKCKSNCKYVCKRIEKQNNYE